MLNLGRRRATPIATQLRSNAIAILSLVFAVTSLGYTTWRNEVTEYNRNVRTAGFEILLNLAELQLVVDYAHYEGDEERGNPITGWTYVLVINDLAAIMPDEVETAAVELKDTWQVSWSGLGTDTEAVQRIEAGIREMRATTVATLDRLR